MPRNNELSASLKKTDFTDLDRILTLEKENADKLHKYKLILAEKELKRKEGETEQEFKKRKEKLIESSDFEKEKAKEVAAYKEILDKQLEAQRDLDRLNALEGIRNAYQLQLKLEAEVAAGRVALENNSASLKRKDRKKFDSEEKKALDTKDKKEKALRAQAFKQQRANQHTAAIEELTAVEELNKQKLQNESELIKQQILHATKLGDVVSANGKSMAENMMGAATAALNAIGGSVEKYLDIYTQNMGTISARIQGAGYEYTDLVDNIRKNTAANPFIKTTSMLSRLNTLVEAGINDNLMQRAFLDEISEKIATTFDATEQSLLNIVRIQQQDSTASRLGMEAYLTRMFNHYFSDTSYLSKQFDAVQETLTSVSAQLTTESSIEFEYIVQKWLGALSSVGATDSTVSKLAEGIAYLGSGNIEALQSDEALQNLLVMSANKAGLSYTDMLINGISGKQTNALMKSVVEYVQGISTSSNNVLKAQYADLFGVSITDMQAFHNLNADMIDELYASAMTYSDTLTELNSQLAQVSKRTHVSEMINNLFDNTLAGIGMNVANNTGLYITYKAADMLEKLTGGINLPFISALGNGVDLNMSLEGLIKGGVLGISTMGQLFNAIGSLTSGGGMNPDTWVVKSNKGQGFAGYRNAGELTETTSSVSYVSNTDSTGMQQSLVDQQKSEGETVMGTEDTQAAEDREEEKCSNIAAILEILKSVTTGNAVNVSIEGAMGVDFSL